MSIGKLPVFRFAPSPNGLLHLGHAYSALLTCSLAKCLNGKFLLRMEDIDISRSNASHKAAIYRDLHWLGLKWPEPVRHQSDHLVDYQSALDRLNQLGLIYPCFASRSEIRRACKDLPSQKTDPDGALLYPGLYKTLSLAGATTKIEIMARIKAGEPYALRLHMDKAIKRAKQLSPVPLTYKIFNEEGSSMNRHIQPERWGDVIIARKDIATSYHLSVVVDDESQGITHICRGKDLEAATDVHRILQINLGLSEPLYHHHALVLMKGAKLSKSKSHPSLFELREKGISAQEIREAASRGPDFLSTYLP